jgi:putative phosphoesterase
MRIAIISDIHGNLTALEATLADLASQGADQVVCLGDVASSGPQPHEVLRRLQDQEIPSIMGNTDAWLLNPKPYTGEEAFHQKVYAIDEWCARQLSAADREYLRTFEPTLEIAIDARRRLLCYHGSPQSNQDIIVATTPNEELERFLGGYQAAVLAGGHTHAQMLRRFRESIVINPGSVGLPYERVASGEGERNVPWAEYALLSADGDSLSVAFRRVPLDVSEIVQAALSSGMPHADWWVSDWAESV